MKRHCHSIFTNFAIAATWVLSFLIYLTSTASSQGLTVGKRMVGKETAIGGLGVPKQIEEIRFTASVTLGSNADSTSMVVTMNRPNLMYTVTASPAVKLSRL